MMDVTPIYNSAEDCEDCGNFKQTYSIEYLGVEHRVCTMCLGKLVNGLIKSILGYL